MYDLHGVHLSAIRHRNTVQFTGFHGQLGLGAVSNQTCHMFGL